MSRYQKHQVDVYERRLVKREVPRFCDEREEFFLKKAGAVALKSGMNHQHGSVIVLNDEIISTGYNQFVTHFQHNWSLHSEVDALRKIGKHVDLTNAELYVVRINKNHEDALKMSRPCLGCQEYILKRGIGKVYFSWSNKADYGEYKNQIYRTRDTKK